jgi:hypothetical protein
MAHTPRNACPENVLSSARVFFITTQTSMDSWILLKSGPIVTVILRRKKGAGAKALSGGILYGLTKVVP